MTVGKQLYYSGYVQGVGFRYTAREIARDYSIAGYVRNLPNGQVELVVEGSPEQVDAYLAALAQRMADCIEHTETKERSVESLQGFNVRS